MRGARLIQLTFLLAFALAFPVRFLAQVPTDNVLTNADIVKMTKAGLSESITARGKQVVYSLLTMLLVTGEFAAAQKPLLLIGTQSIN